MLDNHEHSDPRSQLIKAMNGGMLCLGTVCELAAAHPELYDAKAANGWTPLHFAMQLDLAKLLLARGANVKAKTCEGLTPLHLAAIDGSQNLVELLLANKAEVDVKDNKGHTPLHFAAKEGQTNVVKLLLSKGANVNAKTNIDCWTPLHFVAWQGHEDIAELLIAKHADVNARSDKGETPLSKAINWNSNDVIALLRAHGAKE